MDWPQETILAVKFPIIGRVKCWGR